jgi:hypothetical protein
MILKIKNREVENYLKLKIKNVVLTIGLCRSDGAYL